MATDIDWSAKPYPWNEIGLEFRSKCEEIAFGPQSVEKFETASKRVAQLRFGSKFQTKMQRRDV